MTDYRLKKITYQGRKSAVLLQNENGPCPLIAIANILLLRGGIHVSLDKSVISSDEVINLIADFMVTRMSSAGNNNPDVAANLSDALASLPDLQFGMDVNPRFCRVTDFEFSKHLVVFDVCNITLRHGWLVDPQDSVTFAVLHKLSYNQATERVVAWQSRNSSSSQRSCAVAAQNDDSHSENFFLDIVGSCLNDAVERSIQKVEGEEYLVIDTFLAETAHQLTYHGLCKLYEEVPAEELSVFFRNNHFCTMLRVDKDLYTLVTDEGFADVGAVVWEKLSQIDGDAQFCSDDFRPMTVDDQRRLSALFRGDPGAQRKELDDQAEMDYALALELQSQENSTVAQQPTRTRPHQPAVAVNPRTGARQMNVQSTKQTPKQKDKCSLQ
eukprot:ANDGO_02276.mRNA.1 Uncharacterized protein YPL191C